MAKGNVPKRRWPLLLMFGALYFVQGLVEPTASLPAQPLQTWLESIGYGPGAIGRFFGAIGLGWSIKPIYGLLSDFLPIFGSHRLSYLLLSTLTASGGFVALSVGWQGIDVAQAQWALFLVGVALALTDVVVDAVAVEYGQEHGLTGVIQSVQWGSLAVASLAAGVGGGWVASDVGRLPLALSVCAGATFLSFAIVAVVLRERRSEKPPRAELSAAVREVRPRLVPLLLVALFLFLLNFNPFSSNVLKSYATGPLALSEQTYGGLLSVQAAGSIVAAAFYGAVCRRIAFGTLLHLGIAAAVVSTACYWMLSGAATAVVASAAFGVAYQLSTLVTLDLAARVCPRASAATVFAGLMSVCNWGVLLGVTLGGSWYEALIGILGGEHSAFHALVGLGALTSASAWLVVPFLKRVDVA